MELLVEKVLEKVPQPDIYIVVHIERNNELIYTNHLIHGIYINLEDAVNGFKQLVISNSFRKLKIYKQKIDTTNQLISASSSAFWAFHCEEIRSHSVDWYRGEKAISSF
jgi:hypothetical protein